MRGAVHDGAGGSRQQGLQQYRLNADRVRIFPGDGDPRESGCADGRAHVAAFAQIEGKFEHISEHLRPVAAACSAADETGTIDPRSDAADCVESIAKCECDALEHGLNDEVSP